MCHSIVADLRSRTEYYAVVITTQHRCSSNTAMMDGSKRREDTCGMTSMTGSPQSKLECLLGLLTQVA